MAASLYSRNQQAQKQGSFCTSLVHLHEMLPLVCCSFTCIGEPLAAAVLQDINTRLLWALGSAGSCWHVLRLLSWGSPVQGGASALRAARASGGCGCVSTSSMQPGTDTAGLCPSGHHPHPCSALLAGCCRTEPCWGGHCPVPHHHPWTPGWPVLYWQGAIWWKHSATSFSKTRDSSLRGCRAGVGEK